MIEAVIYDKPAVMGLVSPFSNIYMIVGEEAVMLIHETLHCKHPTPMTIQLHPQCLLGIQGILRNWTFLIFKQV